MTKKKETTKEKPERKTKPKRIWKPCCGSLNRYTPKRREVVNTDKR